MQRLKFMLFSVESALKLHSSLLWIGSFLEKIFPSVQDDLEKAEIQLPAKNFLTACFLSAFAFALLFFAFTLLLSFFTKNFDLIFSILAGFLFFIVFLIACIFSPKIVSLQLASEIDQNLVLALRSILMQITSGTSLYDAMVNVAKSDYGIVSKEFKKVVQSINAGDSEVEALEKIALNSKSEYLSRACWQILTALRSGGSLANSIASVVDLLLSEQERKIKNYSSELNLFVLIYLLFAAAVPTLGVTFLVIFSSLGGTTVGVLEVFEIIIFAFITQIILIGFVKSRTPRILY